MSKRSFGIDFSVRSVFCVGVATTPDIAAVLFSETRVVKKNYIFSAERIVEQEAYDG